MQDDDDDENLSSGDEALEDYEDYEDDSEIRADVDYSRNKPY